MYVCMFMYVCMYVRLCSPAGFSDTMISGSSEMMTTEEGHPDLDSCSETSSGGGRILLTIK